MFFFLSKTAGILVQPLVIVSIIFIAGLVVRKPLRKKILLLTSLSLLLVFSNHFLAYTLMRKWEIHPVSFADVNGVYDYGIVLTGITKGKAGPEDRVYFGCGADRATHTLQLYRMGLIRKVIISGGVGQLMGRDFSAPEADELATFMILAGIKKEDILIENRSKNTHESSLEVSALVKDHPGSPRMLLISSAYHLRRAKACFTKTGLLVDVFATEPLASHTNVGPDMFIIPRVEALGIWQVLFREWAGMAAYKLAGYI